MKEMKEACMNYGPVKKERQYQVVDTGRDWHLIRVHGKSMYCPKWVFEKRRKK